MNSFFVLKSIIMQSTIHHSYRHSYERAEKKTSLWKKFISWADGQEENRFGWTAIAITSHGCVLTILTAMVILMSGNHFIFWPFAIGAMAMCVVVNLAAMPTKITIPVFFFSILIDLAIIAICFMNGFNIDSIYR
jgi:hypothetical protein